MNTISFPTSELITDEQVSKLQDIFDDVLRKSGIRADLVQKLIDEQSELVSSGLLSVIKKQAEAIENILVRRVKVDRSVEPSDVLSRFQRVGISSIYLGGLPPEYLDIIRNMPRGEGGEAEVFLLQLGRFVYRDDLSAELEVHGLQLADPYSLAAVILDHPTLVTEKRLIATQWKNAAGAWCYMRFEYCEVQPPSVFVDSYSSGRGSGYGERYWIACLRR